MAACSGGGGVRSFHFHPGALILFRKYKSSSSGDANVSFACLQYNLRKANENYSMQADTRWAGVGWNIPVGMNFPVSASEKAQYIITLCMNTMNLIFVTYLHAIQTVRFRVCNDQCERRIWYCRPIILSLYAGDTFLWIGMNEWIFGLDYRNVRFWREFNTNHFIQVIFHHHILATTCLIYDLFSKLLDFKRNILWIFTHSGIWSHVTSNIPQASFSKTPWAHYRHPIAQPQPYQCCYKPAWEYSQTTNN